MTDKALHHDTNEEDPLNPENREAQLHYSNVAGRRKKGSRGAGGPMPVAGGAAGAGQPGAAASGAGSSTPAMGMNPGLTAAQANAQAQASGVASASATSMAAAGVTAGPMAAGSELRFDGEELHANGIDAGDDPWGAYDNPENIPGFDLDDEGEYAGGQGTGLAVRGSGTRGGSKGGNGLPMAPMGPGAGAAAGGPVAAGGGAGIGGAAINPMMDKAGQPVMMLPNATLGGVSAAPGALSPQALAYQQAMAGAQQGSMPLSSLAAMQSARASNAVFAPPASGVVAAGNGDSGMSHAELSEALQRIGINSDQATIVGPDGNIYPNPFHRVQQSISAPTGTSSAVPVSGSYPGAADLNGDGVVSAAEAQRWQAAQSRTGDGTSYGINAPTASGPVGQGISAPTNGYSSTGTGSSVLGDSATSTAPVSYNPAGSSQGITTASNGVKSDVDAMDGSAYSASGFTAGKTFGRSSYTDFVKAPTSSVASGSGHGTATGTDLSFDTGEMESLARDWQKISARQQQLSQQIQSLPNPEPIFGVLESMNPAYEHVRTSSAHETNASGEEAAYTATNTQLSAVDYSTNESDGAAIAGGMND